MHWLFPLLLLLIQLIHYVKLLFHYSSFRKREQSELTEYGSDHESEADSAKKGDMAYPRGDGYLSLFPNDRARFSNENFDQIHPMKDQMNRKLIEYTNYPRTKKKFSRWNRWKINNGEGSKFARSSDYGWGGGRYAK